MEPPKDYPKAERKPLTAPQTGDCPKLLWLAGCGVAFLLGFLVALGI